MERPPWDWRRREQIEGPIVVRHSAGAVADGTEDAPLTRATRFRNRVEAEAVPL